MDRPGSCGDWLKAGRSVAELVRDLEISDQTIYNWRRQELIDTAQMPGVTSHDQGELMAARRRVAELETELTIHRRSVKIRIRPGPATGPAVMATLRNTAIGYHQIGGKPTSPAPPDAQSAAPTASSPPSPTAIPERNDPATEHGTTAA
ncbi:transposase [Micromonospora sp. MW-13]|uniref:transposase n=1 Tax=Micromonospora sp. MW-13 TaxID=2094022 RepID=UPI000E43C4F3|nr:transposase [Micromonospora sp. MW-13]